MELDTPLTASQIEFLAEDELITVIPNFKMPALHFIRGAIGPFHPSVPVSIPLWLAVVLKKRRMCKIQIPHWMDADYLRSKYDDESKDERLVEEIPFHYMEIATLLLSVAPDDVTNVVQVRALLEDIWNRRAAKVRDGLLSIDNTMAGVQLNHLSAMEINKIRPFIVQAMSQFFALTQEKSNATM